MIKERIELTKDQKKAVIKELKSNDMKVEYDSREGLGDQYIEKIINGKADEVEADLWENNIDYIGELEDQFLKDALKIAGIDYKELGLDFYDLRDDFLDYLCIDINMKGFLNNASPVNVRIELISNFDCINSHWFETAQGGGYSYKSTYFGDTVDALNFNPRTMKKFLNDKGIRTFGYWPGKPNRDGKELITYDAFWQEEENRCCGACLLTILATIDLEDFIKGSPQVITIPKGNNVGFFSSFQGGGSTLEAPLQRDTKINLDNGPRRGDNYSRWRIIAELDEDSYGVKSVYGCNNDIFSCSLLINKYKKII